MVIATITTTTTIIITCLLGGQLDYFAFFFSLELTPFALLFSLGRPNLLTIIVGVWVDFVFARDAYGGAVGADLKQFDTALSSLPVVNYLSSRSVSEVSCWLFLLGRVQPGGIFYSLHSSTGLLGGR